MKTILTVSTLIIANNKVLLCLKKEGKIRNGDKVKIVKDIWVYQGGAVEKGETTKEAAIREAYEEAGIKISINKLLTVGESIEDNTHWLNFIYLGIPANDSKPQILETKLFSDIKYFNLNDLPKNISPATLDLIKSYSKYLL